MLAGSSNKPAAHEALARALARPQVECDRGTITTAQPFQPSRGAATAMVRQADDGGHPGSDLAPPFERAQLQPLIR